MARRLRPSRPPAGFRFPASQDEIGRFDEESRARHDSGVSDDAVAGITANLSVLPFLLSVRV